MNSVTLSHEIFRKFDTFFQEFSQIIFRIHNEFINFSLYWKIWPGFSQKVPGNCSAMNSGKFSKEWLRKIWREMISFNFFDLGKFFLRNFPSSSIRNSGKFPGNFPERIRENLTEKEFREKLFSVFLKSSRNCQFFFPGIRKFFG